LLLAAYLIEAGLVLIVTPWTGFWVRNYFAQSWPWLGSIMFDPYVRGAVTGIGVITAIGGFRELVGAFLARRSSSDVPPSPVEPPRP
jgi:hypothetical protein